jgi:hypothetical protein
MLLPADQNSLSPPTVQDLDLPLLSSPKPIPILPNQRNGHPTPEKRVTSLHTLRRDQIRVNPVIRMKSSRGAKGPSPKEAVRRKKCHQTKRRMRM